MPADASALERSAQQWTALGWPRPDLHLVSGSGLAVDLGGKALASAPLAQFLPFAVEAVEGHPLRLDLVRVGEDRHVLYQRGRLHAYQGFSAFETVFSVRLAARLGSRTLLLTNAAGGVDPSFVAGDLVLVRDHLNLTGRNPLTGPLPAAWGPSFPDMTGAYDPALRSLALRHGGELGIELREGVYAGVFGPSYETPAEVEMLRRLGAHLVGMSTVLEVIAARHMGVRCLCLSLVTNPEADPAAPLGHAGVLAASRAAAGRVQRLLAALVRDPALFSPGPPLP